MNRTWFALPCLAFVLACPAAQPGDDDVGGSEEESDASGSDSSGTDGEDATTTSGETGVEPLATVAGATVDMQGATVPTPGIQLCGPIDEQGTVESCLPAQLSDDKSTFTVGAPKLGLFALKVVHGPLDGRYFTGQSFQLELAEGDALDYSMPPITIPETDTVTDVSGAMGPTEVVIEGGLTLTVDPATATSPDFTSPTAIGGLDVAPEFWRVSEVEGAPVIKAWSLYPFGTHADEGTEFGLAITDALGLPAGETVAIYGIQKDNGALHHVADGTVNGDATGIDLVSVEGLHELSWVLVVD